VALKLGPAKCSLSINTAAEGRLNALQRQSPHAVTKIKNGWIYYVVMWLACEQARERTSLQRTAERPRCAPLGRICPPPPGNVGGGSTGPHQLVQGIKGAQPGAPERPAARRPAAPHPGKDQRATGQSQSRAFLHSFSYSSQQQESL
jgi:hypothetical protein